MMPSFLMVIPCWDERGVELTQPLLYVAPLLEFCTRSAYLTDCYLFE
jgi:hypothetical protein